MELDAASPVGTQRWSPTVGVLWLPCPSVLGTTWGTPCGHIPDPFRDTLHSAAVPTGDKWLSSVPSTAQSMALEGTRRAVHIHLGRRGLLETSVLVTLVAVTQHGSVEAPRLWGQQCPFVPRHGLGPNTQRGAPRDRRRGLSGVTHGTGVPVAVTTWSLQHGTVSPSPHGPARVAQCCSTAPRRHRPWCHMVSLSLHAARGVTVAAWPRGATQCHCSSHGLSHRVTVTAWCTGVTQRHVIAWPTGVTRPHVTAVPQRIAQHCRQRVACGCHPALLSLRGLGVSRSAAWQCHGCSPARPVGHHSCHCTVPNPLGDASPWSPMHWGMCPHGPRAGPVCPPHPCPLLPGKQ